MYVSRVAQSAVNVLWLDNFSKFYAVAVQVLGKAVAECLWTARGLHRYVGPPVATDIVGNMRGMPVTLFSSDIMAIFKRKMATADRVACNYLRDSVCFKMNVRQIPLKPEIDAKSNPALAKLLHESRDGMRDFIPLDMLAENIGSNRGLLLLFKDIFGQQIRPGHFSFLSVDCNIFLRVLKV